MSFPARLCNPVSCLAPADSSVLSYEPSEQSSSSIKSFVRRYFPKKRSMVNFQSCPHVNVQNNLSARKFQRLKGFNIVQEIPRKRSVSISKTSNNYDMTIFHDDELNNSELAMVRRRKKRIPLWAQKDQLQLAIINQVYFQDKNPEDIFGNIRVDHVQDIVNSINFHNKASVSMIVSRHV